MDIFLDFSPFGSASVSLLQLAFLVDFSITWKETLTNLLPTFSYLA